MPVDMNGARTYHFRTAIGDRLAGRSAVRDGIGLAAILLVGGVYARAFLVPHAVDVSLAADFAVCQHAVQAWLGGRPMYPAFEVQGPYNVAIPGLVLYPPVTILLFAPSLLLPAVLWWLIPGAIFGAAVYRMRPNVWALAAMAYCLVQPIPVNLVVVGNPDIWLAAALAVAFYWRPAAALVLLKPSLFPLALFGFRSRGWWMAASIFALVSLALLPQTLDWLRVIQHGYGVRSGLTYSLDDLPLVGAPLVAWAGSVRRRSDHVEQTANLIVGGSAESDGLASGRRRRVAELDAHVERAGSRVPRYLVPARRSGHGSGSRRPQIELGTNQGRHNHRPRRVRAADSPEGPGIEGNARQSGPFDYSRDRIVVPREHDAGRGKLPNHPYPDDYCRRVPGAIHAGGCLRP